MVIYDFRAEISKGYRGYTTKHENDVSFEYSQKFAFDTNPMSPTWEPLRFSWIAEKSTPPERKHGDISKCWCLYGGVILSQRAIDILRPALKDQVEFLPLICDEPNVCAIMRVLNHYDYEEALNVEKSTIHWSNLTPEFRMLDNIANNIFIFREDVIKDSPIFKIKQFGTFHTFVTQEFKDIITENNLTGGRFKQMYPYVPEEPKKKSTKRASKKSTRKKTK